MTSQEIYEEIVTNGELIETEKKYIEDLRILSLYLLVR